MSYYIDWSKLKTEIDAIDTDGIIHVWKEKVAIRVLQRESIAKDLFDKEGNTRIAKVDYDKLNEIKDAIEYLHLARTYRELHPEKLVKLQQEDMMAFDINMIEFDKKIYIEKEYSISLERVISLHNRHIKAYNIAFPIKALNEKDESLLLEHNGCYLVDMKTLAALHIEGRKMAHCVAANSRYINRIKGGTGKVLSLRKGTKRIATISITNKDRNYIIEEARGKANKILNNDTFYDLFKIARILKWQFTESIARQNNLIETADGNFYHIKEKLPRRLEFKNREDIFMVPNDYSDNFSEVDEILGNLKFSNIESLVSFNKLKKVDGNVFIEGCNNFLDTGSLEEVTENLIIKSCWAFESTKNLNIVGKSAYFTDCHEFKEAPCFESVGATLSARNCLNLKEFPVLSYIGNIGDFENCRELHTFGSNLKFGALDISSCEKLNLNEHGVYLKNSPLVRHDDRTSCMADKDKKGLSVCPSIIDTLFF